MPLLGITAYEGLMRANTSKGQNVLVRGCSGGVGHIALQLANYMGANVFATGWGDKQLALITKLDAKGINYKTEEVEEYVAKHTDDAGFDVVFDSVGGENMTNSFNAAALNGQVASTVSLVELDLSVAYFKGLSLHVVFMLIPMLHNYKREVHGQILNKLTEIAEAAALLPELDEQSFSLEDIAQAYDRLSSGQGMGKVVIDIN